MHKRAIVVGASSGIGAALVRRLVADGHRVAAVARREKALEDLCDGLGRDGERRAWAFPCDVTNPEASAACFDEIVRTLDGLDLVIYAAGVMPEVAEDEFDTEKDRHVIEVNVIGAMNWLNLAARRFQVQRGGTIVGIGSVAGERGRRGNPAYCASKAALHTYLESLRNRLAAAEVHVLTVKPGPVRTPMTEGRGRLPMIIEVDRAADAIARAIDRKALVAWVPPQWGPIMWAIRMIPSFLFRRMRI